MKIMGLNQEQELLVKFMEFIDGIFGTNAIYLKMIGYFRDGFQRVG